MTRPCCGDPRAARAHVILARPAALPPAPPLPRVTRRLLRHLAADPAALTRVSEVRIGLAYTGVQLVGGRAGVSLTYSREANPASSRLGDLRPLRGRPARDLLRLLQSPDPIDMAVGLATANALVRPARGALLQGDVLDQLNLRPDDRVGMVGYFRPMVENVLARVSELIVFERIERREGLLRPAREAFRILPRCQVALITATTLLTRTIDPLLEACRGCREVVLLGPSTPLLPALFRGTPVTLLSGVQVTRPRPLFQILSEGGGMRLFDRFARKVNLRL